MRTGCEDETEPHYDRGRGPQTREGAGRGLRQGLISHNLLIIFLYLTQCIN